MVEKGRCVVVTGGASGIGAGIVRRLTADGFWVAIFDTIDAPAQRLPETYKNMRASSR